MLHRVSFFGKFEEAIPEASGVSNEIVSTVESVTGLSVRQDLYTLELETGKLRQLNRTPGVYGSAAVSNDGKAALATHSHYGELRELVMVHKGRNHLISRIDFANAGVARISLGSGLARVTQGALIRAARAILGDGEFSDILDAAPGAEVENLLTYSEEA